MRAYLLAGLLALACLVTACPVMAADNVAVGSEITLPPPRLKGPVSVEEALARRRSVRQFAPRELTMAEISQLAWAALGQGRLAALAGELDSARIAFDQAAAFGLSDLRFTSALAEARRQAGL